jgi:hypothetical protein
MPKFRHAEVKTEIVFYWMERGLAWVANCSKAKTLPYPLTRPSATLSLREKGEAGDKYQSGNDLFL